MARELPEEQAEELRVETGKILMKGVTPGFKCTRSEGTPGIERQSKFGSIAR